MVDARESLPPRTDGSSATTHARRRGKRKKSETHADDAAAVALRISTLLRGGVPVADTWRYVAQAERVVQQDGQAKASRRRKVALSEESVVALAARTADGGGDAVAILEVHPHASWRALGSVWRLAASTGAPLSAALNQLTATFRDLSQAERDVDVALSGPVATSRIVLSLPAVGIVLGSLLGFDTIAVLFTQPLGWGLMLIGGLLLLAGWRWNRALVRKATVRQMTPGFALDLVAMGMHSGRSGPEVLNLVRKCMLQARLEASGFERAEPILQLAAEAGVPAADLLRSEAKLERVRARTEAAKLAARLGVELMLPLGACILPAFIALGVLPLVVAVLQRTMGAA